MSTELQPALFLFFNKKMENSNSSSQETSAQSTAVPAPAPVIAPNVQPTMPQAGGSSSSDTPNRAAKGPSNDLMNHLYLSQQNIKTQQFIMQNLWDDIRTELTSLEPGVDDLEAVEISALRIKEASEWILEDNSQSVSTEASLILSRMSEIFVLDLALRAWLLAEFDSRSAIQESDVIHCVDAEDTFDFLTDSFTNTHK